MALVASCLSACAAGVPHTSPVLRISVCSLLATPKQFDGRRVIATANVVSDGLHSTHLMDSACPPGGVSIGFGSEADPPDVRALFDAVLTGVPGTGHKRIRATVQGLFRVVAGRVNDEYRLKVEHVEELVVTPVP